MQRLTQRLGWMGLILTSILLVCVLCATVVAVSHIHPLGERSSESHCSLCLVGAAMVAVVGTVVLVFRSLRFMIAPILEPGFISQIFICLYFIRPPPKTVCFH